VNIIEKENPEEGFTGIGQLSFTNLQLLPIRRRRSQIRVAIVTFFLLFLMVAAKQSKNVKIEGVNSHDTLQQLKLKVCP